MNGIIAHGQKTHTIQSPIPLTIQITARSVAEAQVRSASEEQAGALVDAGADAIIIETQTSLEELLIGLEAAQTAGSKCIIGSMAYDVTLDEGGSR